MRLWPRDNTEPDTVSFFHRILREGSPARKLPILGLRWATLCISEKFVDEGCHLSAMIPIRQKFTVLMIHWFHNSERGRIILDWIQWPHFMPACDLSLPKW